MQTFKPILCKSWQALGGKYSNQYSVSANLRKMNQASKKQEFKALGNLVTKIGWF